MHAIDWVSLLGRSHRCNACPACPHAAAAGIRSKRRVIPRVSPVVWSLGFTSLLTDVSAEMVSSILPMYLVLHLRLSPLAFGVVDGVYQGFAALLRIAGGFAGDRWRQHKLIAATGYGLSAVSKLGILLVGGTWSGIAGMVALDRMGKGIRTAPRDALITLNSPCRELGQAFGVHRALDAVGAMMGPLLAFALLALLPGAFDVIFVVSFCIALIGVAVIVLFVDPPARPRHLVKESAPSVREAAALLREPRFRSLVIASGVLSVATMSDAFVFLALQHRMQFNAGWFPLLYVGVSCVNFLFAIPGGQAADKSGRLPMFLGGHALLIGVYALVLLPTPGLPHVALAVFLLGAYYAATDGVLAAMVGTTLPARLCGSGLSVMSTATNLGRLAASMLFGAIWNWWSLNTAVLSFMIGLVLVLGGAKVVILQTAAHRIGDSASVT